MHIRRKLAVMGRGKSQCSQLREVETFYRGLMRHDGHIWKIPTAIAMQIRVTASFHNKQPVSARSALESIRALFRCAAYSCYAGEISSAFVLSCNAGEVVCLADGGVVSPRLHHMLSSVLSLILK